jgi:DNA modification methylase
MNGDLKPIISTARGKASAADNFPFHNWYNFILGYTPEFPDYIIKRENLKAGNFVVDPFMGSGTTLVCCKQKGIRSAGIEANDFFKFAADIKLNWDMDIDSLRAGCERYLSRLRKDLSEFDSEDALSSEVGRSNGHRSALEVYAESHRPPLLVEKYISNRPLAKLDIAYNALLRVKWAEHAERNFCLQALSSIVVPSSNVKYGPGFGVAKPRADVDVYGLLARKLDRMLADLDSVAGKRVVRTPAKTILGDARGLSEYLKGRSVDCMITSPPYPGDHEYTKYSRLELMFLGMAPTLDAFRNIKTRMIRGSTTNIYKDDNDGAAVRDINSIAEVTRKIQHRLRIDNATSGFEKLYSKLVWEYFGGMYRVFQEAYAVLRPGGKFVLLVSDSHAFKMVHIETARLLEEVASKAGFVNPHVELWQYKVSTSHKFKLLENILTIEKPV